MEQVAVFEEKVVLVPGDLRNEITSFDDILLQRAKRQIEKKCSRHGYVIPNSLQILSRSLGIAEKGRFTSDFIFYLKLQGKVYNPPDGFQVEAEVLRKNKMGLYLIVKDAIQIMVPRDLHIGNDEFDSVEQGDIVRVEIKKSRFQVNDPHILSIGQFLGKVGASEDGGKGGIVAEEAPSSSTGEEEEEDSSAKASSKASLRSAEEDEEEDEEASSTASAEEEASSEEEGKAE